jgi:hypothetical protein
MPKSNEAMTGDPAQTESQPSRLVGERDQQTGGSSDTTGRYPLSSRRRDSSEAPPAPGRSTHGSGVFARANPEPPVGLHSQLERAFDAEDITLDFFGITGETLQEAIREPMDKIRTGRHHPRSIRIRALVPEGQKPRTPPPSAKTRKGAPGSRTGTHSVFEHHLESLLRSVTELAELGLVQSATAEVRSQPASPLFKLYIINGREAFQGFDPIGEQVVNTEKDSNRDREPKSKDTPLFHQEATDDPEAVGSQYVNQANTWFESIWTNNSNEVMP